MACVPSCSADGCPPPPPLATWRLRKSLAAALVCTLLKSLLASDFILALVSFMRVGLPHAHTAEGHGQPTACPDVACHHKYEKGKDLVPAPT